MTFNGLNHFTLKSKILMSAIRCTVIELTKRRVLNVINPFNVE